MMFPERAISELFWKQTPPRGQMETDRQTETIPMGKIGYLELLRNHYVELKGHKLDCLKFQYQIGDL